MAELSYITDYPYNIAEMRYAYRTPWYKMGYNADVDNAEEDLIVQGGTYTFPAAAGAMDIVSSSSDDCDGGTGIRTIRLHYLDTSFVEHYEERALDGTTPVTTVATDIFRVNNMRAHTVGTGGKAAGNITLSETGGTTYKYGYIAAGYTRQRQIIYTVPSPKHLYITSIVVSSANSAAGHWSRFTLRCKYDDLSDELTTFFIPYFEAQLIDQTFQRTFEIPGRLPSGADLKMSAISDGASANSIVSCAMRGYLAAPITTKNRR